MTTEITNAIRRAMHNIGIKDTPDNRYWLTAIAAYGAYCIEFKEASFDEIDALMDDIADKAIESHHN